jgi:hypothetical protein
MRGPVAALRAGNDSWETFNALFNAWGNRTYSLKPVVLQRLYRIGLTVPLPILDIGSGLSTIVAAVAAERAGIEVHALESGEAYVPRLQNMLEALNIGGVSVHLCETRDGWYAIPQDLPDAFGLVVVDGPMELANRGLVYDLLADRLASACVIADDINIRSIAQPFNRWTLAAGRVAERFGSYAVARPSS